MSRPTVTVISAKGESGSETVTVPNVFKVSPPRAFLLLMEDLEGEKIWLGPCDCWIDAHMEDGWKGQDAGTRDDTLD